MASHRWRLPIGPGTSPCRLHEIERIILDDPKQGRLASDFIGALTHAVPGFVCREVLVELVWVLERGYALGRAEIASVIEGLLAAPELVLEEADDVGAILELYEAEGFGFSGLMIRQAARRAGAIGPKTFDRKAARLDGVELRGDKATR